LDPRWLTLAEAATRLGVHTSTLRRWASHGEIPVVTTVGGHRRFAAEDVQRFIEARRPEAAEAGLKSWVATAADHARHEVSAHRDEPWLAVLDEGARRASREMGRRLMGLLMQYIATHGPPARLEPEIQRLGLDYGRQSRDAGLSLSLALQATVFFRDALFESALHPAGEPFLAPEHSVRLLRRLNRFVNLVQLAIAETYDAPLVPALPEPQP
jgi:excisionase family DNA binding protein